MEEHPQQKEETMGEKLGKAVVDFNLAAIVKQGVINGLVQIVAAGVANGLIFVGEVVRNAIKQRRTSHRKERRYRLHATKVCD